MRAPNNRSRGFRAPDFRAPDFWAGSTRAQRPTAGLLSGLLSPLGALFDLAGRLRRATTRPRAMPLPVICVGNLVAGGAGKTPVVLALLRALAGHDLSVHVLTRGYRGTAAGPLRVDPDLHDAVVVGDEALLLARHAPTWVSRDRPAGAEAALRAKNWNGACATGAPTMKPSSPGACVTPIGKCRITAMPNIWSSMKILTRPCSSWMRSSTPRV